MAESSSDFTENSAETKPAVLGAEYTPTEEERRVFKQCDSESFCGMAVTHILVTKVAGMCGYFAGKLSYMKTCQQKFYNLENSPIAEALRQRHHHHPHHHQQQLRPPQFAAPRSELSEDEEKPRFDVFQTESASDSSYSPTDYSDSKRSSSEQHDFHKHAPREEEEEEEVKRKPILYEQLRNKNRENYDITRNQKLDRDTPKKEVKKNKYGDMLDE
ncbi:OCIA domain-containing protein 1 [Silurus asotus]|uniref:OCIA domain-containing protein 1 n=1 Tax=Silurus asotus TaxID=30991 RepID=A0AAD5B874_SILAS|nr:OCIA domain-containing protein 1 [Silurus asotus]